VNYDVLGHSTDPSYDRSRIIAPGIPGYKGSWRWKIKTLTATPHDVARDPCRADDYSALPDPAARRALWCLLELVGVPW